jgi:hypothetical protein
MNGLLLYFAAVPALIAGFRSPVRAGDLHGSGPPGTRTLNPSGGL